MHQTFTPGCRNCHLTTEFITLLSQSVTTKQSNVNTNLASKRKMFLPHYLTGTRTPLHTCAHLLREVNSPSWGSAWRKDLPFHYPRLLLCNDSNWNSCAKDASATSSCLPTYMKSHWTLWYSIGRYSGRNVAATEVLEFQKPLGGLFIPTRPTNARSPALSDTQTVCMTGLRHKYPHRYETWLQYPPHLLSKRFPAITDTDLWINTIELTLYRLVVSIRTTCFNTLKLCILPTECICVFHMDLTINSDCFPKQH
jgi:hypothetical protein